MTIHCLNIIIPIGTHSYNGYSWIVDSVNIYKSVPYYNDKFSLVYTYGQVELDIILRLELIGLARTIASK